LVKKGIRRQRRRRAVTGVNVSIALLLMGAAMVMLNIIVAGFPFRWDLGFGRLSGLSEKTIGLLNGLEAKVDVVAFLPSESEQASLIRDLLKEYEHAAARKPLLDLSVEIVDPHRNLARTRELAREYEITEDNVVVFDCEGRRKYVGIAEIAEYDVRESETGTEVAMVAFKGEQAFSSAILSITQGETPVVYFLQGHGERSVEDYGRQSGYSSLARIVRHDNMEVRELLLAQAAGVPADCAVLVIAGAAKRISAAEVDMIGDYLANRHGRVLLLVDPSVKTGIESLLEAWGVRIGSGIVSGLTLSGTELVVRTYGDHPITRRLGQLTTMFYKPCPVESFGSETSADGISADRARVTALAMCEEEGWEEFDPSQRPASFDAGTDRPGPVSVAVAVEKGALGVDVEIEPTRLVVIGDSFFVSNAAISSGMGGNATFFMSGLNWLAERESLLALPPKLPHELRLDMSRRQLVRVFVLMVLAFPCSAAVVGFIVLRRRRRA